MICLCASGCVGSGVTEAEASREGLAETDDGGDVVDLTEMSSTMVYAEVYNIMTRPFSYLGKTIKIKGPYVQQYSEEVGKRYHYVLVEDAAACCQQGMEFIWSGDHIYPEDYPNEKAEIEIEGLFSSYEEHDRTYFYLLVDSIAT